MLTNSSVVDLLIAVADCPESSIGLCLQQLVEISELAS